ncbi:hypothetical protein ARMGADRAFT_1038740 [Armillaria gallica]|uniref:Uncharacterized protein n=1 Tax=Armillaria gallica TaxID=47427 RepID=A0A2H3CK78_ARMGA|nr:hypothetical protein ARMGADRAFT_1038740 [Armillaria gallica]
MATAADDVTLSAAQLLPADSTSSKKKSKKKSAATTTLSYPGIRSSCRRGKMTQTGHHFEQAKTSKDNVRIGSGDRFWSRNRRLVGVPSQDNVAHRVDVISALNTSLPSAANSYLFSFGVWSLIWIFLSDGLSLWHRSQDGQPWIQMLCTGGLRDALRIE